MSTQPATSVLVADDHLDMAKMLASKLADDGWKTRVVDSGTAAVAALEEHQPDLVLTDLRMPGLDGLGVLDAVRTRDPRVPVILMTAFGDVTTAVEAMRRGAWHFVTKPVRLADIVAHARRAVAQRVASDSVRLVGDGPAMRALARTIARVGPSSAPVLVRGETGTGKELVARAVHAASDRRLQPFVAVNCTALPESLAESELFGHARGAFTGALAARAGLFAQADGGTLFLDEIGDMPMALQAKLLRVLQDGEIRPVGAEQPRRVDVRVIAATHQDLAARIRSGQFREDLYYRLDVVPIDIPPLRERREDIPALAEHFFSLARARNRHAIACRLSPDLVDLLIAYPWPGNVRELATLMERLAITAEHEELGPDQVRSLAPHLLPETSGRRPPARLAPLREIEDDHIAHVLEHCEGNKARAAEILGIDLSTLYRRARARSR